MQRADSVLAFSPSDLTGFTECIRLTRLEREVADGQRLKPHGRSAYGNLVARKADQHEAAFVARLTRPGHRMLGRGSGRFYNGAGYEYLHVCVDDHTRLAYADLHPDEWPNTVIAFLTHALAFYKARGITCERVLTDNGNAYISRAWRDACNTLALRHTRTRPRRPQTNGKAERTGEVLHQTRRHHTGVGHRHQRVSWGEGLPESSRNSTRVLGEVDMAGFP